MRLAKPGFRCYFGVVTDLAADLIAQERAALDRWCCADTEAYADRCDEDVDYFDTYSQARIDGTSALRTHLAGVAANMRAMLQARGKAALDRHEMLRPRVRQFGDAALLTYDWVVYVDADSQRWRATVVYGLRDAQWRVVHAHWSVVQ